MLVARCCGKGKFLDACNYQNGLLPEMGQLPNCQTGRGSAFQHKSVFWGSSAGLPGSAPISGRRTDGGGFPGRIGGLSVGQASGVCHLFSLAKLFF